MSDLRSEEQPSSEAEGRDADDLTAHIQELREHRRWIDQCRLAMSRDRDKMVLAIAAGSLGISVAFLEKAGPSPAWLPGLLVTGWCLEIIAIVLVLNSLHSSQRALQHEHARVDAMLKDEQCRDPGWSNPDAERTEQLDRQSSLAAVVGVGFIVSFAAINILYR